MISITHNNITSFYKEDSHDDIYNEITCALEEYDLSESEIHEMAASAESWCTFACIGNRFCNLECYGIEIVCCEL